MSEFSIGGSAQRVAFKRRFDRTKEAKPKAVSPSYGVHRGFIRNPNWPPGPGVEMPTDRRMAKRVRYQFDLLYAGNAIAVNGDLSETGAMFVLDRLMPSKNVEISVRVPAESEPRRLAGEVIRTSYKGQFIAHHVKFFQGSLDGAIGQMINSGAQVV